MAIVTEKRKQHVEAKVQQALGFSEMIMAVAAGVGFIACFMTALTVEVFGISQSEKLLAHWQSQLSFFGYIAVGVMALRMMKQRDQQPSRNVVIACVSISGVIALLGILLALSIGVSVPDSLKGLEELTPKSSKGIGLYINVLAGLAMLGGSALTAKKAKLF